MTIDIGGIYLSFSCGRRGVNDPECRWCGREIHQQDSPLPGHKDGAWYDGAGRSSNTLVEAPLGEEHEHEPALEEMEVILGPFEEDFVQLTYDSIRSCEGELIAFLNKRGDWEIHEPWTGAGECYSDITIMTGDYKSTVVD